MHEIPIEVYVFCDVTLLRFLSLLSTLLSMVVLVYSVNVVTMVKGKTEGGQKMCVVDK